MEMMFKKLSVCLIISSIYITLSAAECYIVNKRNGGYILPTSSSVDIEEASFDITSTGVSRLTVANNEYASFVNNVLTVTPINESQTLSTSGGLYYNKLSIQGLCDETQEVIEVHLILPTIDTNTYEPIFEKDIYEYNLLSNYVEDLQTLLDLNPIIGIDNDVTNSELIFSISKNDYFTIGYGGIVPNTLNKKHFAQLIRKQALSFTKAIELNITVTDIGFPPKEGKAVLRINPPSPPKPVFVKSSYIGDYYSNKTFAMRENPKLEEGTLRYITGVTIYQPGDTYFAADLDLEGNIIVSRVGTLSDITFYKNNYLVYELTAYYYADNNNKDVYSTGSVAIIVELHHDN